MEIRIIKASFPVFNILVRAFMVVWTIAIIWLGAIVIHQMLSREQPLVINGQLTTWGESIGFVLLVFAAGAFGLASMFWGLRLFRRCLETAS